MSQINVCSKVQCTERLAQLVQSNELGTSAVWPLHPSLYQMQHFAHHGPAVLISHKATSRHRRPKCKRSWRPLASVITTLYSVVNIIFFIVECGIARFLCAMRVFEVWASCSSDRLRLCQISFLSWPPLLS